MDTTKKKEKRKENTENIDKDTFLLFVCFLCVLGVCVYSPNISVVRKSVGPIGFIKDNGLRL